MVQSGLSPVLAIKGPEQKQYNGFARIQDCSNIQINTRTYFLL